jgi:hypothetical protein
VLLNYYILHSIPIPLNSEVKIEALVYYKPMNCYTSRVLSALGAKVLYVPYLCVNVEMYDGIFPKLWHCSGVE